MWVYAEETHVTPSLIGWDLSFVFGFVQDCNNSIANTMDLLQSCTWPPMWYLLINLIGRRMLCPQVAVVMTTSIFSVLFCGVGLLVAGLTYIIATVPTGNAMNEDIISNSKVSRGRFKIMIMRLWFALNVLLTYSVENGMQLLAFPRK